MQQQRFGQKLGLLLRVMPLFSLAALCVLYASCTSTTLPFLQHFKHPMAVATIKVPDSKKPRYHMYVANADIDRLAVVDVTQRSLVLNSEDKDAPGILYVRTGRRPVDVAASPDQKRLYTLHAIDGNMWVYDTTTNKALTSNNKTLMIPRNCARQPGCWSGPIKLLLHQRRSPSQLLGFVALAGEKAVAVVNLNEADPSNFGKELSRIRLSGRPTDMWFGPEKKNIYVSDDSQPFVHVIEPETLSVRQLSVKAKTLTGSVSLDNKWLYLIDAANNGIRIFDLKSNKVVSQGDQRFKGRKNIRIQNASFLGVTFLPAIKITVRGSDGNNRSITKSFAWANASDGYGYLIDPDEYTTLDKKQTFPAHRILDTDEAGPSVSSIKVSILGSSLGDPRQPIRNHIPRLVTNTNNEAGITLVHGKTRTELWSLTYQGVIVPQRSGRFSNLSAGEFVDVNQQDLAKEGVKAKDTLIFHNCGTAVSIPDAGNIPDSTPVLPTCEVAIKKVSSYIIAIDPAKLSKLPLNNQTQWSYSIRSSKDYIVVGSVTGRLKQRIQENVPFLSDYFQLQLDSNTKPTKRDTLIQFKTTSGVTIKRLKMGGLPTLTLPQDNHLLCGGPLCNLENCKTHPACTNNSCVEGTKDPNKQCNPQEVCTRGKCIPSTKLWVLDSAGGRLFVINPTDAITLETTIR